MNERARERERERDAGAGQGQGQIHSDLVETHAAIYKASGNTQGATHQKECPKYPGVRPPGERPNGLSLRTAERIP